MTVDRMVVAFAGSFVLISVLLAHIHNLYWLWFSAFVGAIMLQSAFTGFCPLAVLLKKVGIEPGRAFD